MLEIRKRFLRAYRKLRAHPNRWTRRGLGVGLTLGGVLGPVLPFLGVWMLPLGLILLAVDLPQLKPYRRRYTSWWRRKFHRPGAP